MATNLRKVMRLKVTRVIGIIFGVIIVSIAIGVISGFGYGKYLLLVIGFSVIVFFSFVSYSNFLILLLFLSSNVGLISQRIAIQMANGSNLVEIRDLVILIAIIVGLIKGRKRIISVIKHPLIWPGCTLCGIAFIGALVGFFNGGDTITIIKEFYVVECWVLPLAISTNVTSKSDASHLFFSLMVIGLLVAVGGDIEAATHNTIRLVSNVTVGSVGISNSSQNLARAIPDANCLLAFTSLVYFVFSLTTTNTPFSKKRQFIFFFLMLFTLASSFFFQLRTTIAVFVLGAFVFLLNFQRIERFTMNKAFLWCIFGLTFLVVAFLLIEFLKDFAGNNVVNASLQRFKNLVINIKNDGRIIEYPFVAEILVKSPIFGIGFGSDYRSFNLTVMYGEPSPTLHNILNYFLVKMGLLGFLPFTFFIFGVIKTFRKNIALHRTSQNLIGIALSLGLIGLIIQSLVGNVFGLIQSVPIVMVVIGLTVANEKTVLYPKTPILDSITNESKHEIQK